MQFTLAEFRQQIKEIGSIALIMLSLVGCAKSGPGSEAAQKAAQDATKAVNEAGRAANEQTQAAANQMKQETSAASKSAQTSFGDAGITTKVQAKIIADPLVGGVGIDVKSEKGVVTLQGTVKDKRGKSRATEDAQSVRGVAKVVNKLTVKK
jgi:hyperosmotically inducible protein